MTGRRDMIDALDSKIGTEWQWTAEQIEQIERLHDLYGERAKRYDLLARATRTHDTEHDDNLAIAEQSRETQRHLHRVLQEIGDWS